MKKIGSQIKFDTTLQTANKQLELLNKKATKERIESVKKLIKQLDQCIKLIEQTFSGNSRINQKDVQIKVQSYKQKKRVVVLSIQKIQFEFKKNNLIQTPQEKQQLTSEQRIKYQNRQLAQRQQDQLKGIKKQLVQAKQTTKNTVEEIRAQQQVMKKIEDDAEQAQGQLSMINEFMGIISNRNLLTRLILLFLAVFLGFADIAIIIFKIG